MPNKSQPPYPDPPLVGDSLKRLQTGSVANRLPVSRQKSCDALDNALKPDNSSVESIAYVEFAILGARHCRLHCSSPTRQLGVDSSVVVGLGEDSQ